MARKETVVSIFVASPSDVEEERSYLGKAIDELNLAWAREQGVRLELISWDTHAYPAFGDSPQALINKQIPQDYDIFLGIMWFRFGTPTEHAGSGTEEEFIQAKEHFDKSPEALQLMIYFKDEPAPISPTKIDSTQLTRVTEFRASLGPQGGLYWTFHTAEEFASLIRLHLTRYVQEKWPKKPKAEEVQSTVKQEDEIPAEQLLENNDENDIGLLDLVEQVEDEFSALMEVNERIADATKTLGENINVRANEIKEFSAGPTPKDPRVLKRLIANAAADMDDYVHRMGSEIPLFSQHLNSGMSALTKVTTLSIEFDPNHKDIKQIKGNKAQVSKLCETMSSTEIALEGFRDAVVSIPRLTSTLNRSKRATTSIIQRLIDELRSAQNMASEAEISLNAIIYPSDS